jgi:hypothetical protein
MFGNGKRSGFKNKGLLAGIGGLRGIYFIDIFAAG